MAEERGVWRTIRGRRVFIREGEDLSSAMKRSGKFDNLKREDVVKAKHEFERRRLHSESEDLMKAYSTNRHKFGQDYWREKWVQASSWEKEEREFPDYYDNPIEDKEITSEKVGKHIAKNLRLNDTFEVGDLKRKALETLPKEHIDSHASDLYLKKTKESTELLNRMKDKDSGLLSTFRDQQTGEEWYEVPFANMEDELKEKYSHAFPYHKQTEAEKKYADEVAEYFKGKDIKEEVRKAKEDYNKANESTTISFGKIDAYGNGRKSNEATIEMSLKDGRFSASGNIWNSKHTDIISGGQNLDEMRKYFKGNKEFENVYSMWKKYHLNDMHAGTIKQEEALSKKFGGVNASKYDEQVNYLKSIGLYEDEGYKFGTGWLKRDIPEEDLKNITNIIRSNNSKNSLAKMSLSELRQEAQKYNIDTTGLSKQKLMAKLITIFNK